MEDRLYHGTPNVAAVLRAGVVLPSKRKEVMPTLMEAVDQYKKIIRKYKGKAKGQETWADVAPDEIADWKEDALIPMRGYAYATINQPIAALYSGRWRGSADPGVVEVTFTSDDVIPDEDWIGCVAAYNLTMCSDCDMQIVGDPDAYEHWATRLRGLLNKNFLKKFDALWEFVENEIDWDGFCALPLSAILGRTVIRDIQRTERGQDWLLEGLEFTDRFAHKGPLKVVTKAW